MQLSFTPITLEPILPYLERLVAFDTRNGPGEELPCAAYLKEELARYSPDRLTIGTVTRSRGRCEGAYVLAVWGTPRILLNVHLDTVPSGEGWTGSPHKLRREGDVLTGLGTSDIKGAMACILGAMKTVPPRNVAVLFSGDEEQGSEVMIDLLSKTDAGGAPLAIVCEPTGVRVGRAHRGFASWQMQFEGPGGHSSLADVTDAPVLDGARMGAALGDYGAQHRDFGPEAFKGLCVNVGSLQSDGAHNVIPTQAELRFSLRPPPGDNLAARIADINAIASRVAPKARLTPMTAFAPFGTRHLSSFAPYFRGEEREAIDLPYWTEAALLSEAGIDCVVFGPGDVEQAHKPNEHVTAGALLAAAQVYARALSGAKEGV